MIDPMQHMQPAVDRLIDDIGTRILFNLRYYRLAGGDTLVRVTIRTLLARFVNEYHRLPHHDDTLIMTDKCIEDCFITAIKFLINDGFIKIGLPAASGDFKDRRILDYYGIAMPNFRAGKFRE